MKKTLNILQLVNTRWYNACAHYAVTISCGLQKRGHRVIVAGDKDSPPLKIAKEKELEIYPDLFLSHQNPGIYFYNLKRLSDLIETGKINLVNAHQGEGHLYASFLKKLLKKNFVLIRTRGDQRKPRNNIFNLKLNRRWTDGIITTADVLRGSYVEKFNLNQGRLINIPLGIDPEFFCPIEKDKILSEELGISEDELVVGILGRLSPIKGHRYFIQAAFEVLKSYQKVKFLIAGEDAQIRSWRLKKWIKEMGSSDKFLFIGKVDNPRKIISLMDIGVIASTGSETVCRVALEYMSMGKPVVGTWINAVPEVVKDQINGFVVKPEDGHEMGQAILRLLTNKEKRDEYGKASRKLVEKDFSLESFASRTEEFYFRFV